MVPPCICPPGRIEEPIGNGAFNGIRAAKENWSFGNGEAQYV
jgi:hypothetical protein